MQYVNEFVFSFDRRLFFQLAGYVIVLVPDWSAYKYGRCCGFTTVKAEDCPPKS
jgi:hypothetical protein